MARGRAQGDPQGECGVEQVDVSPPCAKLAVPRLHQGKGAEKRLCEA